MISHPLLERFSLLSLREKCFILAAVLATLWMVFDNYFLQAVWQQQSKLQQEIASIDMQLDSLAVAQEAIEAQGSSHPNQHKQQTLSTLKAELKQLEQQIQIDSKRFVDPGSMGRVLAELLAKKHALQLIHVETLPVTLLTVNGQPAKARIFQHGLNLSFSGNYKSTLVYLQALEASPWRFLWQNIHYKVQAYPTAKVTITVYTLGFQEDWLRV